jgi:nucleotide-binding universal stress UspA family protein
MSLSDILLRVMPAEPGELDRLSVAADLACRLNSRLNGVFVAGAGKGEAEWAQVLFGRAVAKTSLETTWRVIDGSSSDGVLYLARRSDLTIIPGAGAVRGSSANRTYQPEQLALQTGGPVLILPTKPSPTAIGNAVLVGWNDTRESARAIHDSMPILAIAERVYVLSVIPDRKLEPASDIALLQHLRQHGVAVELERRYSDDAAGEIASESRRTDSDIIVIGLHQKNEHQRWVVGDVTRRFVRTGSFPVFCSH